MNASLIYVQKVYQFNNEIKDLSQWMNEWLNIYCDINIQYIWGKYKQGRTISSGILPLQYPVGLMPEIVIIKGGEES